MCIPYYREIPREAGDRNIDRKNLFLELRGDVQEHMEDGFGGALLKKQ